MGDTTIGDVVDLGIPDLDSGRLIGTGASARVYRSRQRAVDRPVAVKVLGTRDPELVRRFGREARALGRLSRQPGIVSVYDYGETDNGQPYLVLELCDRSLRDRIVADGKLEPAAACSAGLEIAKALAAAHQADVVHRDIKPGNILIDHRGHHLISDFGISTLVDTSSSLSDHVGFTAGYAAPEVFDGDTVPGTAADLYALGATMVHMLTGRPPFFARPNEGLLPTIARIAGEPPPDLTEHGVPEDLDALLARTLAKSPTDRPSLEQLIAELEAMVDRADESSDGAAVEEPSAEEAVAGNGAAVEAPGDDSRPRPNSITDPTTELPDETGDVPAQQPAAPTGPDTDDGIGRRRWRRRPLVALVSAIVLVAAAIWWFVPDDPEPGTLDHEQDGAAAEADQPSGADLDAQSSGRRGAADRGANEPGDDDPGDPGSTTDGDASPTDTDQSATDDGSDGGDTANADGETNAETDRELDDEDGPTDTVPETTPNGSTTTDGVPVPTTTTSPTSPSTSETTTEPSTTSSTEPTTTVTSSTTESTSSSSQPTTTEGPLVITGIEGSTQVPCGVGTRRYTASTNGVEVTSWDWSSQLRTTSPTNSGPSLDVEFRFAVPGEYTIGLSANDGEANASVTVTVTDGVNC